MVNIIFSKLVLGDKKTPLVRVSDSIVHTGKIGNIEKAPYGIFLQFFMLFVMSALER